MASELLLSLRCLYCAVPITYTFTESLQSCVWSGWILYLCIICDDESPKIYYQMTGFGIIKSVSREFWVQTQVLHQNPLSLSFCVVTNKKYIIDISNNLNATFKVLSASWYGALINCIDFTQWLWSPYWDLICTVIVFLPQKLPCRQQLDANSLESARGTSHMPVWLLHWSLASSLFHNPAQLKYFGSWHW